MRLVKRAGSGCNEYHTILRCESECRSGERGEVIFLGDRGYHSLRPIIPRVPIGPWLCSRCSVDRPGIAGCTSDRHRGLSQTQNKEMIGSREGSIRTGPWSCGRREGDCCHIFQLKIRWQGLRMCSLAYALTRLKLEFSNELTYMCGLATNSSNQAMPEMGVMQVLAREDKETLGLCRVMYGRGQYPPLIVVFYSFEAPWIGAALLALEVQVILITPRADPLCHLHVLLHRPVLPRCRIWRLRGNNPFVEGAVRH